MKKSLLLFSLLFLLAQKSIWADEERLSQATTFPTSPPTGLTYYTVSTYDNSAEIALWDENGALYIHAVPITNLFNLAGNLFTILQNNQPFSGFQFYNEFNQLFSGGNIADPFIFECRVPNTSFDYNQPFDVCYDTAYPYENCFTFTPSENLTLGFTFKYSYSIPAGTTAILRVEAEDQRNYRFYMRSGYGTPAYSEQQWQQIQPLSSSSTCTYTFNTPGHYIVVCHILQNVDDTAFETVGFSIEVTE